MVFVTRYFSEAARAARDFVATANVTAKSSVQIKSGNAYFFIVAQRLLR
jgi:hypothetical protein